MPPRQWAAPQLSSLEAKINNGRREYILIRGRFICDHDDVIQTAEVMPPLATGGWGF